MYVSFYICAWIHFGDITWAARAYTWEAFWNVYWLMTVWLPLTANNTVRRPFLGHFLSTFYFVHFLSTFCPELIDPVQQDVRIICLLIFLDWLSHWLAQCVFSCILSYSCACRPPSSIPDSIYALGKAHNYPLNPVSQKFPQRSWGTFSVSPPLPSPIFLPDC